jgi:hypothetical protein
LKNVKPQIALLVRLTGISSFGRARMGVRAVDHGNAQKEGLIDIYRPVRPLA